MKRLSLALLSASLLLAATTAKADPLTITLTQPFQTPGLASGVLTFNATVINTTGGTLYLNGDDFSLGSPLTLDDSPYLNTFPLSLAAGGIASGELFAINVPLGAPFGLYAGSFEITGGSNASINNVLGTADFNVQVSPEPSSVLLVATGLAGLGGALRRRRGYADPSKAGSLRAH